ncbi:MAG: MOSC domain-containing protein [Pseudomonadota bacterium]
MAQVSALWRHPIKGHGRESVETVKLTIGETMPWDRRWAVAHELAEADGSAWVASANFSRGSKNGALMAINASCDPASGTVTLSHPELPDLTFDPDKDQDEFLRWVRPLMPANRAQSVRIVRVEGRGMTDTDYASISLLNVASNDDVSEKMQQTLSVLRWRCNVHVSGFAAWTESTWLGKTLRIGGAVLEVQEPILRCKATTADPATGIQDADTLQALNTHYGHQNFGVYAKVTQSGDVRVGDKVEVLAQ